MANEKDVNGLCFSSRAMLKSTLAIRQDLGSKAIALVSFVVYRTRFQSDSSMSNGAV